MPKGKDFNLTSADAVIEVITKPGQVQALHALDAGVKHGRTDTRLSAQKQECLRDVLIEGLRRKITVLVPPLGGTIDLGLRTFRDADFTA